MDAAGGAGAPGTWHYGVVAQWWSEFNAGGPEIACFRAFIERYGEPALDVACGAGRLLLPYLRDGLDVDGCDISADMLAWCRSRAGQQALAPALYRQAMHELDLPRAAGGVRPHPGRRRLRARRPGPRQRRLGVHRAQAT